MKQSIPTPVVIAAIVVVVGIALALGWKTLGPRTDGPDKPVDMAKMMGKK